MSSRFSKRLLSSSLLTLLLGLVAIAQDAPANSSVYEAEFECGLTNPTILLMNVSVFNPHDKSFVRNLDHDEFEVLVDGKRREIEFYLKPSAVANSEKRRKFYTVGFRLDGQEADNWKLLKVAIRLRKLAPLRVYVTPEGIL